MTRTDPGRELAVVAERHRVDRLVEIDDVLVARVGPHPQMGQPVGPLVHDHEIVEAGDVQQVVVLVAGDLLPPFRFRRCQSPAR